MPTPSRLKRFYSPFYRWFIPAETAPFGSLEDELVEFKPYLKGRVLNAGAGLRDISTLVDGELINQDISRPDRNWEKIQIVSPIHEIPVPDAHFDTIICNAVLEHVINPDEILLEFYRVLKPGGHLLLGVPFLQPEHKSPTDYQRYTKDGLTHLVEKAGFHVLNVKPCLTIYHTLYWQVWIWLHIKSTPFYLLLRILLLRPLLWASQHSRISSDRLASFFQLIGQKE
jgi:SAM-dependent methyltransferase